MIRSGTSLLVACWLGLAGVAALTAGGCATDQTMDLVASARPTVPDVPVPGGFTLEEKKSRSRSRGSWRTVDFLYRGDAEKFAVVRFYEKQMPVSRWELLDKKFVQGQATLNFVKDKEFCCITISGQGGWKGTFVHVDISPAGDIARQGKAGKNK